MTAAAPHPDMTIDEAINAAHRAAAEMGIRISPSRVNGSSKLTGQSRGSESDAGPLGAGAVEAYPAS